jgi:hypothetical protein
MPMRIALGVRVGVHSVRKSGLTIMGRWLRKPRIVSDVKARELLCAFANAQTDAGAFRAGSFSKTVDAVQRFTSQWGPLLSEYEPDESFEVDVARWCAEQIKFRDMWQTFGSRADPLLWRSRVQTPKSIEPLMQQVNADLECLREKWGGFFPPRTYTHFAVNYSGAEDIGRTPGKAGHLRIGAHTISHFLTLNLFALDGRSLRKCLRPLCPTPFFVANDLRQRYCSDRECRKWGRGETKRAWWGRSGKQWRQTRARMLDS